MYISDIERKFLYSLGIRVSDFLEQSLSSFILFDDRGIEIPNIGTCICNNIECNSWNNLYCSVYMGENYIKVVEHTRTYELKILRKEDGTLTVEYTDTIYGVQCWTVKFEQIKSEGTILTVNTTCSRPSMNFLRKTTCSRDKIITVSSEGSNCANIDPSNTKCFSNAEEAFTPPSSEGPVSLGEFKNYLALKLYREAIELLDNSEETLDTNHVEPIKEFVQYPNIFGAPKVMRPMSK